MLFLDFCGKRLGEISTFSFHYSSTRDLAQHHHLQIDNDLRSALEYGVKSEVLKFFSSFRACNIAALAFRENLISELLNTADFG